MLEVAVKSRVMEGLEQIVGNEFVSVNQADLYIYSQDMTLAEPSWPEIVVLPKTVGEVQAIVRLANKEKIPITPYVAGGNIGGLSIPLKGGISLDLKRMDRIIEVNEVDMYAIVEPGVLFGHLKAYLENNHPDLMYTYAYSPPSTSVLCNALLQGLDDLSFRYGSASHWISGMEVILPTGELVRIGSCAVSETWQELDPLPGLAGLFIGWQGATGIVAKMAVSLWPKQKHAAGLSFAAGDMESAYELIRAVARTRVPNDMTGTSYAFGKMSQLATQGHVKVPTHPALTTTPEEPEFIVTADVSGNTENELKAKVEVIEEVVKNELQGAKIMGPMTQPSRRADLPMQVLGILSSGGGLTWVGTYGPMSKWLETAKRCLELQDKHGFTRSMYTRILREGHFAALRWLLPFNKENPDEMKRLNALCADQLDTVLKTGYIPYKTPIWAIRKLEKMASPEWVELMRRVKKMLDPNNIMNPGRWGAPQG